MVLFNYSTKELTAKVVYYGPGLCGKTTNLQFIHQNLPDTVRGKMLSLATKTDRTLFFDFLPMDLGEIRGMKTRMQLYTVPGQVFYNETRKLVLKGADGIVFVADSQQEMLGPNVEAFKNLEENLKGHGLKLAEMPHVIQLNKRDLPKLATIEELNSSLNKYNAPFYESVATTGIGVQDSLKAITKLVLLNLTKKYEAKKGASASKRETATEAALNAAIGSETPAVEQAVPVAAAAETPAEPAAVEQPAAVAVSAPVAPEPASVGVAASAPAAVADDTPISISEPDPVPAFELETPSFVDDEIDDLVDEVNDTPSMAPVLDSLAAEPPLGQPPVDRSPLVTALDVEPSIQVDISTEATDEVTLSPAGPEDVDLFDDPSLEVAYLTAGTVQDIVIPVQIGTGDASRRYKLSLRLNLESHD